MPNERNIDLYKLKKTAWVLTNTDFIALPLSVHRPSRQISDENRAENVQSRRTREGNKH